MLDLEEIKPERIRGLRRVEYEKLIELGIIDEDEKLELLRGMLVTMSQMGRVHAGLVVWLTRRLIKSLDDTFEVRPALPFAANDDSEPQPDLLVCKATVPLADHPSEALLLIEISDSSIRKDRNIKMPLYAEVGVPEYWIFDVSDDDELVISVYTEPSPTGYGKVVHMRDGVLRPLHLPIEIAIADIPR